MDIDLKEKFTELLMKNGIEAEMGVTPVKYTYILNCSKGDEVTDFWYVETDGGIDTGVPNFVKWNIADYIFACVRNEDYENGRYMIGKTEELKGYGTPEGIREDSSFMTMSFTELLNALK